MTQSISPIRLKEWIDSGEDFLLLDVRTPEEFHQEKIKNAVLIPYDEIQNNQKKLPENQDKKIVIYCYSGSRSMFAAKMLEALGYANIYDLTGGLIIWKGAGFKLE